ncbi:hypothetical protein AAG906_024011 [Vitis piasezkii]
MHYKHLYNLDLIFWRCFCLLPKEGKIASSCPLTRLPSIGDGAAGFDEGRGEGTRGGPGCVGGATGASGEAFFSKLLDRGSGSGKEGPHICHQHSSRSAKGGSAEEHYIRRISPSTRSPEKRKLVKNGKGVKEPIPPKEFVPPPITHEVEVMIEEPVNPTPPSISSGSGHVAGLNHSGPSASRLPDWLSW